jgi:hypothetical protein
MRWRAHSHCSRKIRRSAISCPSGLSWSCRMKSARTSLGDVRTRRRSRRAAGPSASARRAASSQNTGARAYQWPGPEAAHATRMYISTEAGWSKGYLDLLIYSTSQRHIVLAARVGVRLRSDRALTGRAATRIIDPCARKRPVATCFGAPSPGRRLSARSALAASPRSLGHSTHGASASGSSRRRATARTGARHSSLSGSPAPC